MLENIGQAFRDLTSLETQYGMLKSSAPPLLLGVAYYRLPILPTACALFVRTVLSRFFTLLSRDRSSTQTEQHREEGFKSVEDIRRAHRQKATTCIAASLNALGLTKLFPASSALDLAIAALYVNLHKLACRTIDRLTSLGIGRLFFISFALDLAAALLYLSLTSSVFSLSLSVMTWMLLQNALQILVALKVYHVLYPSNSSGVQSLPPSEESSPKCSPLERVVQSIGWASAMMTDALGMLAASTASCPMLKTSMLWIGLDCVFIILIAWIHKNPNLNKLLSTLYPAGLRGLISAPKKLLNGPTSAQTHAVIYKNSEKVRDCIQQFGLRPPAEKSKTQLLAKPTSGRKKTAAQPNGISRGRLGVSLLSHNTPDA